MDIQIPIERVLEEDEEQLISLQKVFLSFVISSMFLTILAKGFVT